MSAMDRRVRRRIFARSLLLQACWNDERMQNIGFAYSLEPWLRRLYSRSGTKAREALRRHLGFFNTQPYMAGFTLGVTGRLEETAAQSAEAAERIEGLKKAMASALAGVGDALFWGTLKPLCAAVALIIGWGLRAWRLPEAAAAAGGIAAYLALFNAPALWIRWRGIRLGYEHGEGVVPELRRMNWQRRIRRLREAGLVLGVVLALWPMLRAGRDAVDVRYYASALAVCLLIKALRFRTLAAYGMLLAGSLLVAGVSG